MTAPLRVLHLDGDPAFLEAAAEGLERADDRLSVATETETDAALERVEAGGVDCLLTETSPPGSERLGVVEHVANGDPAVPVVVVDDGLEDGTAAEALATGAAEFMPRSTDSGALRVLANRVATVASGAAAVGGEEPNASTRQDDGIADRSLVDTAPVAVWVVRDGEVAYANPACARLFGYERGGLAGRAVHDLVAPPDRETLDAHLDALLSGEAVERTDVVTGVGRWGDRPRLELQGRGVETGEGPAVVGAVRNVTEARRTGRRLRTLFEGLGDPVADVVVEDGQAVVRAVNGAFAEAFGVEADAVAGEYLSDVVVPDESALEGALEAYLRLERGRPVTEEVTRATADGERSFRLQGLPYEAGGDPHAFVVYSPVDDRSGRRRDLTELQVVARDLMAAEDRGDIAEVGVAAAERVLDASAACLFVRDEAGEALVPLAQSDAARDLFGELPPIQEGGGPAWYVHEMGDPLVTDDGRAMESLLDVETPVRSELVVPVDGHGVYVVSSRSADAFDERDRALARTLASTLEAALNRAEKERLLRERERELVRENERLEEFAGIVSHDLRSPLAVVKGNVSLLREEGEVRYLDRIEGAADRMEQLIEDLLSLARQGSMVEEPEFVDLDDVVTRAWTTADTRNATLVADLDVAVEADPSRLRQLLENLFNNAVEHGGDDVTVRVDTVEADPDDLPGGQYGRAVEGIVVADDGEGLPEDADDLFEPGTTTDQDGTGFGLAIVKRIAEAHGWTVEATESEAGGARFEFTGVEGV